MKSESSLLQRLDEVRPGAGAGVVRKQASLPKARENRPVLVPPSQKTVVTYRVHGAKAKSALQSWGKWIFFFLAVVVPTVAAALYYAFFASPQYVSEFRFAVRANAGVGTQSAGAAEALLAMSNAYIVSDYVGSRDAVVALDKSVNLRSLYAGGGIDALSRLNPTASLEKLVSYWNSRIHTSYDITTGINIVEISAFTPQDAQKIADALKNLCEKLVNQISDEARKSQMEFSRQELERSEARLKDVRRQETELRTAQKSVDARKEADGRMQLNMKLRGDLASLQSQYDGLTKYMDPKSPRLSVMKNQINAIQDQIAHSQNNIGSDEKLADGSANPLNAQSITRYDQIQTDVEIASKLYESSLTNYEAARAQANNNQIYLATYVQPGLPEIASYPRPFFDTFLIFLSACGIWVVLTLVYYSIRDHV
jgi:capsular polysaccharide transport system permease protein